MNALSKSLLFLLTASGVGAFPPAPYYTLYGIARDQLWQTLSAEGAELILFKGEIEVGRAPIGANPTVDQSYELNVRIDQNRTGTTLYTERVRVDLTLGEDTDGDGLPDVWEEWQLYQAGLSPDENGDWPIDLITRDGDNDGDNLDDVGLIAIYETVLNRAKDMSINANTNDPDTNNALLLAAGYLNDLYTILGNEAWADAANPTISIDDPSSVFEVNTSRFAFGGQVASSLDEELALLRRSQ